MTGKGPTIWRSPPCSSCMGCINKENSSALRGVRSLERPNVGRIYATPERLAFRFSLCLPPSRNDPLNRAISDRRWPSGLVRVRASPPKPYHQNEGPEYRIENVEHAVRHPPDTMRNAVGDFLCDGCGQDKQKWRPCRKRAPRHNPGEKQDDHPAMHMQQAVRGAGAHAQRPTKRAVEVDQAFHHHHTLKHWMNEPVVTGRSRAPGGRWW